MGVRRFALADNGDLPSLIDGLRQRARLAGDEELELERTVYDTFDWRIWREGAVLEHQRSTDTDEPAHLEWRRRDTGDVLGRMTIDEVPRFVRQLPAGPTTDRLSALVEMRALEPLARLSTKRQVLRMLGDEDKTVARVVVDRSTLLSDDRSPDPSASTSSQELDNTLTATATTHPALPTLVEVVPVRGYRRAANQLSAILDAQLLLRPAESDTVAEALSRGRRRPGDYSSKLSLSLDPLMTADEAWITALRTLLAVMHTNEAGMRADRDSEYLHDYRVAVRRTRSVLAQGSGVLPEEPRRRFAEEFKWLGDITSPVRDLDVELLDVPTYEASLPEALRGELAPLADLLHARQREAHAALVEAVDSPRYRQLIEDYATWLDHPGHDPGAEEAALPSTAVCATRIHKAARRVLRDGRAIDDGSAPEALHDLRKDAKKLRYALECYGSLFADPLVRPVVKHLKVLQDCLGDFQDGEVQAASLHAAGDALIEQRSTKAATLMALGHVVENLDERQQRARHDFASTFTEFDTAEVHHRLRELRAQGRAALAAADDDQLDRRRNRRG